MAKMQETPPRFRQTAQEAEFFEETRTRLSVAAQADAVASTVSVDSTDASNLATVITLANELKADVNTLVTDLNAVVTVLNALITKMETARLVDS